MMDVIDLFIPAPLATYSRMRRRCLNFLFENRHLFPPFRSLHFQIMILIGWPSPSCKPSPVPSSIFDQLDQELSTLDILGVIRPSDSKIIIITSSSLQCFKFLSNFSTPKLLHHRLKFCKVIEKQHNQQDCPVCGKNSHRKVYWRIFKLYMSCVL